MGFIGNAMEKLYSANPWRVIITILIIISIWMLTGLLKHDDKKNEENHDVMLNVKIQEIKSEKSDITYGFSGKTRAELSIKIRPEIEGIVETIDAKNGAFLNKGGLIATLEVTNRKQLLERAYADLESARIQYKSAEIIYKKEFSSKDAFITAKSRLRNAEAAYELAQSSYEKVFLRAPFDGYVGTINVEKGDFVSSLLQSVICDFTSLEEMKVEFYVPEMLLEDIKVGDNATINDGKNTYTGIVYYISQIANESTNMFKAEVLLDNVKNLKSGKIVEVSVITTFSGLLHSIPKSVIVLDDLGNIGVKVINSEGVVEFKEIDIKDENPENFLVSGLNEVENVIVLGAGFADPGKHVNIKKDIQAQ